MKRFFKILGITVASVLAVVLIVAAIAVYVVFTPKRLTPIVNTLADRYVTSPHEIGDVELTFFSTFPEVGLKVNKLLILNPKQGAQSDTVLATDAVVAKLNVPKYLKEKTLEVYELSVMDAVANIYLGFGGVTNLDFLNLPQDTVEDTTAFSLPFDYLSVEHLELDARCLTFVSAEDSISARMESSRLLASARGMDDIDLSLMTDALSAAVGSTGYASKLPVQIVSKHTSVNLDSMRFVLPEASVKLADFLLSLNADVTLADDIRISGDINAEKWDVVEVLKLLPAAITSKLEGIDINQAVLTLNAHAEGVYSDSLMPLIDARLQLADAEAAYMEVFPYKLKNINLDADAHIDLNERVNSKAVINTLEASVEQTAVKAKGTISRLLEDPLIEANADVNVNLHDFNRYIASNGQTNDMRGRAKGQLAARARLSDLTDLKLSRIHISANLNLTDLDVNYDSMLVKLPASKLQLTIPNPAPTSKSVAWAKLKFTPSRLDLNMSDQIVAALTNATFEAELSDLLAKKDIIYANASLTASDLDFSMDTIAAKIDTPKLTAYAEYNTKDTAAIPKADVKMSFKNLKANYGEISAQLLASDLTAKLKGVGNNQPDINLTLSTDGVDAAVDADTHVKTSNFSLQAKARRDKSKENILLQWNPDLSVKLSEADVKLASINEKIEIPHISFDYSNRLFDIADSRIIVGNSDFQLKGKVRNIGEWLEQKANLEGELDFTSAHTDVNELMALTSASEGSEETADDVVEQTEPAAKDEKKAYLVPKNVDLKLNTSVTEALIFDQVARELGGSLYVKDGVLVLEEMGFICNAAKLQLTAIYKTPRRNHIYVGLDYHMVDIDMQELVNMIPQIDTMMPMLRSFKGAGEFHLAAETYVNDKYQLKTSTTRGACSISGKDLVLLDSETFGRIAKLLMFNRKTENKIDSISVQATLFKNEIDIYPFCLTMDKYMAAVGGRHNLDMSFNYHISLLKPLYLGVDVKGTFDDLSIKLAKCKYVQDFRPIFRRDIETQNLTLKKMIDQTLKSHVRL